MIISQSDYNREMSEALSEQVSALRKYISNLQSTVSMYREENWKLKQIIFKMQYPEMFKRMQESTECIDLFNIDPDL